MRERLSSLNILNSDYLKVLHMFDMRTTSQIVVIFYRPRSVNSRTGSDFGEYDYKQVIKGVRS